MYKHALTLIRTGCQNRPFFLIVVSNVRRRRWLGDIVEQVGSFDPLPNKFNEKLVALDFDRVRYWLAQDIHISKAVLELLGLSGLLPVHPATFVRARRNKSHPLLKPHLVSMGLIPADESTQNTPHETTE
ncbi:Probable 28S ribosomal protein S16, mitochondrial [Trichuris trichiura]|uniref:Small ribosomal subunit protein bS16m n=1 Tax=Trichuris trichiura TaxID=36087 RepID=A0A077YYU7_TRITR|nr:Probable 28S ribosomal protein S16, mitochondrial [Trichuris trichiura]